MKLVTKARSRSHRVLRPYRVLLSAVISLGSLGGLNPLISAAYGQTDQTGQTGQEETVPDEFPPCQPPDANEYLLLIVGQSAAQRQQIQALVPGGTTTAVCDYFDDVVVRIGGFTNLETASAWAQYVGSELENVQAFVARPPAPTIPATNPSTFAPQLLEPGFAVLVDYSNRPEVALDVQETLSRDVGVVAYRQQPYLLALYTPDIRAASAALRLLSDRNFATMIVDSRQVMLLRSNVATTLINEAAEAADAPE